MIANYRKSLISGLKNPNVRFNFEIKKQAQVKALQSQDLDIFDELDNDIQNMDNKNPDIPKQQDVTNIPIEHELQLLLEMNIDCLEKQQSLGQQKKNILYKHFIDSFNKNDDNQDQVQFEKALISFENINLQFMQSYLENVNEFENEYQKLRNQQTSQPFQLDIIYMNVFEKIKIYHDKYIFLDLRKKIWWIQATISYLAQKIIKHHIFEGFILLVIIWNSVMLAIDDPTKDTKDEILITIDLIFLIIYTIEMSLKIIGQGFLFNSGAYLRDTWNILDFVIVTTAYLPYVVDGQSTNLSSLRSLRVLRPLRTISSIKALRNILKALFAAMRLLIDTLIILIFFFIVFAIAGVQLFQGSLKKNCFDSSSGLKYADPNYTDLPLCLEDKDCEVFSTIQTTYICGKMMDSPNYGVTNFDTFGWAFLNVFQVITLEGWSDTMLYTMRTFNQASVVFFIIAIFIFTFFLVNLTLAVISSKFNEQKSGSNQEEIIEEDLVEHFEFDKFKKWGIYVSNKIKCNNPGLTLAQMQSLQQKLIQQNFNESPKKQGRKKTILLDQARRDSKQINKPELETQLGRRKSRINRIDDKSLSKIEECNTIQNENDTSQNAGFQIGGVHQKKLTIMRNSFKYDSIIDTSNHKNFDEKLQNEGDISKNISRINQEHNNIGQANLDPVSNQTLDIKIQTVENNQLFKDYIQQTPYMPLEEQAQGAKRQSNLNIEKNLVQLMVPLEGGTMVDTSPSNQKDKKRDSQRNSIDQHSPIRVTAQRRQTKLSTKVMQRTGSRRFTVMDVEQQQKDESEASRFRDIIDSRYLKARVLFKEQLINQEDDVLPSKKEKEAKQREYQEYLKIKKKKFRLEYTFDHDQALKYLQKFQSSSQFYKLIIRNPNIQQMIAQTIQFPLVKSSRKLLNNKEQKLNKNNSALKLDGDKTSDQYSMFNTNINNLTISIPPQPQLQPMKCSTTKSIKNLKKNKEQSKEEALLLTWSQERVKNEIFMRDQLSDEENDNYGPTIKNYIKNPEEEKKDDQLNNENANQQPQQKSIKLPNQNQQENEPQKVISDLTKAIQDYKNNNGNQKNQIDGNQKTTNLQSQHDIKQEYFNEILKAIKLEEDDLGLPPLEVKWSGEDIHQFDQRPIYRQGPLLFHLYKIIQELTYNNENYEMWEGGLFGIIAAIRRIIKNFALSKQFDNLIMLCVLMNTIILTLDGLVSAEGEIILNQFNLSFTIMFTIDMGLKLIGMGIVDYLRDKMNIFDGVVVTLSLVELAIGTGGSAISAFRSVRIFRTFRVLRVTRLIRSLQGLSSYTYIAMLIGLFLYIYTLLGMQMYGGQWNFKDGTPRMIYDSFFMAFICVFDLLTMENWNSQLFWALHSNVSPALSILFLISSLFILNYVLLNLFMAIMLDGFDQDTFKADVEDGFEDIAPDIDLSNSYYASTIASQSMKMTHQQLSTYQQNQMNSQRTPTQPTMNTPKGFNNQKHAIGQGGIQESQYIRNNEIRNKTDSISNEIQIQQITPQAQQIDLSNPQQKINKLITMSQQKQKIQENDEDSDNEDTKIVEKKKKTQDEKLFDNIECEYAWFLFSQQNFIRIQAYRLVKNPIFENIILIVIIINSLKLAFDTYINENDPSQEILVNIGNIIDTLFTIVFTVEATTKALAFGFIMDSNSYLRDTWSQLDFFIVVSALIDVAVTGVNLSFVKILRLLRTLRPLRFISHSSNIKLIFTALIESLSGIANVGIIIFLIMLMFAIFGMSLQKDKMWYCNIPPSISNITIFDIHSEAECNIIPGATWSLNNLNCDNFINAMVFLFLLTTQEGWPDYVWKFVDGTESGPVFQNAPLFVFYFIIYLFIGSIFLAQLFTGIIFLNFQIAEEKAKNKYLNDSQMKWLEVQPLIVKSKPDYLSIRPPDSPFRQKIWHICEGQTLETVVLIIVVLNVITLAMVYEGSKPEYENVLKMINLVFSSIFIAEAILKFIAYGIRGYFYNGWNQFDFFVICTSVLDIVMDFMGKSFISFLKVGPQLARIFRVMRVSRLLKLIKSFQGLQKLIQVAVYALPSLFNVSGLVFLVFYIFAVLAVFLYKNVENGELISENRNFKDFGQAILLLFQCQSGENWYMVMFDCVNYTGSYFHVLFHIIFQICSKFIVIQLFTLAVLQQFFDNYLTEDNPLSSFTEREGYFKKMWSKMTIEEKGIKMKESNLLDFYFELEEPLGMDWNLKKKLFVDELQEHKKLTDQELQKKIQSERFRVKTESGKKIMKMNIYSDSQGYLYYNELLFYLYRASLQDQIAISSQNQDPAEATKILKKAEHSAFRQIDKIKRNLSGNYKRLSEGKTETVNPVVSLLFKQMCFKSWLNFKTKLQNEQKDMDEDVLIIPRERNKKISYIDLQFNENNNKARIYLPNTDIYKEEVDQQNFDEYLEEDEKAIKSKINISTPNNKRESRVNLQDQSNTRKRTILPTNLDVQIISVNHNSQSIQQQALYNHSSSNTSTVEDKQRGEN